jgi:hypothetical protein
VDSFRKCDAPPGLQRLARARLHQRTVTVDHALDQHLHFAARVLAAAQPRLHHARIVQHQHVVRTCEAHDVREAKVVDRARVLPVFPAWTGARGAARHGLRDKVGRKE